MLIISDITQNINERFFLAIATLKRQRTIGGLGGFCKLYGISTGNMYTIRNKKQGAVKIDYLYYLVKDFGVSADWLLTGEGSPFRQNSSKTEESQSQGISFGSDSDK